MNPEVTENQSDRFPRNRLVLKTSYQQLDSRGTSVSYEKFPALEVCTPLPSPARIIFETKENVNHFDIPEKLSLYFAPKLTAPQRVSHRSN